MSSTAPVQNFKQTSPADPARLVDPVDEYEDAEKSFQPKSLKFWTIMVGMYLSIFLVALVFNTIPSITNEFDSIEDIGWYGSAYMLTTASFFLGFGRIYQLYSTKWVYLVSIVIFEVGSAICGAAPTSTAFIVGRAIAGLGSAGIFSGGMLIILPLVPLRKRPVFTSIFGIAFGISSVLGPVLGGTLTDNVTWRWCFYINLPIGGFTIIATLLLLHIKSPKREKLTVLAQIKRLDPIGIFFFVLCVVYLILALQWGGSSYLWSAPRIIGLLVSFAVLLIIFVVVEVLTPETAMAPARIVLQRSIAGSMIFMLLLAGGMMSVVYYLAIWFQAAKGDSATHAGISTIPLVLSLVVIGIVAAVFTQKIGYYVPSMLLSVVLCSVGQNVFSSQLVHSLSEVAGLDTYAIINTGATDLCRVVPASELSIVVDAYSYALTRVFVLATALSACMILGALAMEWKSIEGNKASGDSPTTADTILEKGESKSESQSASEMDKPTDSTEGTLSSEKKEREMNKGKAWLMKALGKKGAN